MIVNGNALKDRANRHVALTQIGPEMSQSAPYFWIDSICINQTDLAEKASQVQLMGDIYTKADRVLACVGSHTDDSEVALNIVKQLATFVRSTPTTCTKELLIDEEQRIAHQHGDVPGFLSRFTKAYTDFGNRDYWNRRWIVQEARLAKQMVLLCGNGSISLFDFITVIETFLPPLEHGFAGYLEIWLLNKMYDVFAGSKHLNRNAVPSQLDTTHICRALYEYHTWQCSDFRDRLYALFGFARWPEGVESLVPDYRISRINLIRQVIDRLQGVSWSQNFCFSAINSLSHALGLTQDDTEVAQFMRGRRLLGSAGERSYLSAVVASPNPSDLINFAGEMRLRSNACRLNDTKDGKFTAGLVDGERSSSALLKPIYFAAGREIVLNNRVVGYASFEARDGDYLLQLDECYGRPEWMIIRQVEESDPRFELIGNAFPIGKAYVESDDRSSYPLGEVQKKGFKLPPGPKDTEPRPRGVRPTTFDVFFHKEDFLLWCVYWNSFSKDLPVQVAKDLLATRPSHVRLSSYAMLREKGGDFDEQCT